MEETRSSLAIFSEKLVANHHCASQCSIVGHQSDSQVTSKSGPYFFKKREVFSMPTLLYQEFFHWTWRPFSSEMLITACSSLTRLASSFLPRPEGVGTGRSQDPGSGVPMKHRFENGRHRYQNIPKYLCIHTWHPFGSTFGHECSWFWCSGSALSLPWRTYKRSKDPTALAFIAFWPASVWFHDSVTFCRTLSAIILIIILPLAPAKARWTYKRPERQARRCSWLSVLLSVLSMCS